MTRLPKKDKGRRNLDAYLAATAISVDDEKVGQVERPDFFLHANGVLVGV